MIYASYDHLNLVIIEISFNFAFCKNSKKSIKA